MNQVTVLVGAQWGDEGKGKWVDQLAEASHLIARFQGGNNAGHTLFVRNKATAQDEKVVLHQLPSGIFREGKIAVLLSGVVINPNQLAVEITRVGHLVKLDPSKLWLSENAHVISPYHIQVDEESEAASPSPIGTTKRGIGPTYSEKSKRTGLRLGAYVDKVRRQRWMMQMAETNPLFARSLEDRRADWDAFEASAAALQPFVTASEARTRQAIAAGKSLLLEGAQGTLLDLNHGTYPFVTASSTTSGGAVTSLGIDPRRITHIYGIAKAYVTRVGEGPFPSELHNEQGKLIASKGQEFGATTQRPRRCGWFDAVAMRYAIAINGLDALYLNKMDILSGIGDLCIAHAYEHPRLGELTEFPCDPEVLAECRPVYRSYQGWTSEIPRTGSRSLLSAEAKVYLKAIEDACGIPILRIGTGPGRDDFLV